MVAFPALLQLSFQPPYSQPAVAQSHQMEFLHINDWVLKIHRTCEPTTPHHLIPSMLFLQKICILRDWQFKQKLRKLEVLKHLLWLLHVFIFHSFLASFLFLTVVKIIFMPAKKCSYTYTKDEGHKYSLLMKKFLFFPVKNTLTQYETLRGIFTAPWWKFFYFFG